MIAVEGLISNLDQLVGYSVLNFHCLRQYFTPRMPDTNYQVSLYHFLSIIFAFPFATFLIHKAQKIGDS